MAELLCRPVSEFGKVCRVTALMALMARCVCWAGCVESGSEWALIYRLLADLLPS